jgi:hypothetical protein
MYRLSIIFEVAIFNKMTHYLLFCTVLRINVKPDFTSCIKNISSENNLTFDDIVIIAYIMGQRS